MTQYGAQSAADVHLRPFHFGPAGSERFGVVHVPCASPVSSLLIVPHIGAENIPGHRSIARSATMAAERGVEALRYDPFGHGDSSGTDAFATVADWAEDISWARTALRSSVVDVLAIGLGGLIALRWLQRAAPIRSLVLVDCPLNGSTWKRTALARRELIESSTALRFADQDGVTDLVGFGFSAATLAEIDSLSIDDLVSARVDRLFVVSLTAEAPNDQLLRRLLTRVPVVLGAAFPLPDGLTEDPFRPRVPLPMLLAVDDFLARATP